MIGTVGGWMKDAARTLSESGADAPGRDAQLILRKVLACDELQLLSNALRALQLDEQLHANALLTRRLGGEPIAYIVGYKEFFGLEFDVDNRVLIPRTETEVLVEWIVKNLPKSVKTIVDVGTGSGAIAVSIKKNLPLLDVTAVDISEDALKVARINAKKHNVDIRFKKNNLLASIKQEFDLVAANLPYINKSLPISKEVANEPKIALFAEADGLALYSRLFKQIAKYKRLPILLVEHDPFQLLEFKELAKKYRFKLTKLSEYISLLEPRE